MTDDPRPLNIETIISDIKSGNFPTPHAPYSASQE